MTAIKRKVDNLGRMVIPNDIRELLGIKNNDMVLISTDGEQVVIRPLLKSCPICGCKLENEKIICKSCMAQIKE